MRFSPVFLAAALLLTSSVSAVASTHHKKTSHAHKSSGKTVAASHHAAAPSMDSERASQIQTALIKKGYLTGEPTGQWDSTSIAAMQKLQSDNGWQTKYTPDARALNMLGLKKDEMAQSADAASTAGAAESAVAD